MSTFFISVIAQLIIVRLYVIKGSAKELIASILLRAFNSLLMIDLILRKHSFRISSLIEECCIPFPSVTLRYLWLSPGSRSLTTVVVSRVMFLAFRSFPQKNVALAHLSSPNIIWISSLNCFTMFEKPWSCRSFFYSHKRDGFLCYHKFYSGIHYYSEVCWGVSD